MERTVKKYPCRNPPEGFDMSFWREANRRDLQDLKSFIDKDKKILDFYKEVSVILNQDLLNKTDINKGIKTKSRARKPSKYNVSGRKKNDGKDKS